VPPGMTSHAPTQGLEKIAGLNFTFPTKNLPSLEKRAAVFVWGFCGMLHKINILCPCLFPVFSWRFFGNFGGFAWITGWFVGELCAFYPKNCEKNYALFRLDKWSNILYNHAVNVKEV
jgi:hypothetical protein